MDIYIVEKGDTIESIGRKQQKQTAKPKTARA